MRTTHPTKGEGTKWDAYNGGTSHRAVACPVCGKRHLAAFKHGRSMAPVCFDCIRRRG